MRRVKGLVVMVVLGIVVGACSGDNQQQGGAPEGGGKAQGSDSSVTIQGFLFKPAEVTVAAGEQVTWNNGDEILHTVTSGAPDKPLETFDGQLPEKGSTFAFTFDKAGRYEYFCDRHHHMRGVVVVE